MTEDAKLIKFQDAEVSSEQLLMLIDIAIQNQTHVHEKLTTHMIGATQLRNRYWDKGKKMGSNWFARLFMGTTKRMKKLDEWKVSFDHLMLLATRQMNDADSVHLWLLRAIVATGQPTTLEENTAQRIRMWQVFKPQEAEAQRFFVRLQELSSELSKI